MIRMGRFTERRRASVAHLLLGLDAQGGMGDQTQALFADQLTGDAADAVCLVADPQQRILQVFDELLLTTGQLSGLLAAEGLATILDHLERGAGVLRTVVVGVGQRLFQQVIVLSLIHI